jgi:hypothetical protein
MNSLATAAVSPALVYEWPYLLYMRQLPNGSSPMIAWAAGLGAMYYWAGGIPADAMSFATSYLVGGVAVYGYCSISKTQ